MRRWVRVLIGAILALVGIGVGGTGAAVLAVFGTDGTLRSEAGQLAGSGAALVSQQVEVSGVPGSNNDLGTVTFTVTGDGVTELFVGIATQQQILDYLGTSAYDVVQDLGDAGTVVLPVPGTGTPAGPPADQSFWLEQSTGVAPGIRWNTAGDVPVQDRRLVIMRADATNGLDVALGVSFRGAWIGPAGLTLLAVGGVLLLLGIILILLALRRGKAVPASPGRAAHRSGDPVPASTSHAAPRVEPTPGPPTPPQTPSG